MYLEHFGLTEPPFKITPVTEFFFSGANRGEILDALLYAVSDSEGIIKISGEVGSGKTMLCRMLLERLPDNIKAIYLANPSLSRDELLYAIADGLELNPEGQRVSVLLQNLQNHLLELSNRGTRCVVLVDEAHAMPLETLEELRLLYNLQVGKHKLIQIVLFGQPELDGKLEQTNMRQLKDRILHSFNMQPLSKSVIASYLMFRMRAAGYHGPDIFSPAAVKLIGKASTGLMRRVNILADKSLLAAFVENTHLIEVRHVQAAIRDSELSPTHNYWFKRNPAILAGSVLLIAVVLGSTVAMLAGHSANTSNSPHGAPSNAPAASVAVNPTSPAQAAAAPVVSAPATGALLDQRKAATRAMLAQTGKGCVSIQLFHTEDARTEKLERFLVRAQKLGKLSEIYVIPAKINGKENYRILYGIYTGSEAAHTGIKDLPQRYKDAFSPALYELGGN